MNKAEIFIYLQDDIHITPEEYEQRKNQTKTSARTLGSTDKGIWIYSGHNWNIPITEKSLLTGNCHLGKCWGVPYTISSRFDLRSKNKIQYAMDEIERDTCIR